MTTPHTSTPRHLDHVVIATPDLAATVAEIAAATGVEAEPGGVHPGRGTRNFLIGVSDESYLEIIGIDDEQPAPSGPRPFLVDERDRAVVATWAIHPGEIDAVTDLVGPISDGARRNPAGDLLTWRVSEPLFSHRDGLLPFVIDWGSTPSPATTIEPRAELISFSARHPEPDLIRSQWAQLGTDLAVAQGEAGLILELRGPGGLWRVGVGEQ